MHFVPVPKFDRGALRFVVVRRLDATNPIHTSQARGSIPFIIAHNNLNVQLEIWETHCGVA